MSSVFASTELEFPLWLLYRYEEGITHAKAGWQLRAQLK